MKSKNADLWVSVRDAAEKLNRSERRVQDLAASGRLRSLRDPDSKNNGLLIHAGDVKRLMQERMQLARAAPTAALVRGFATPALAGLPAEPAAANAADIPKTWLTVAEASACGLNPSYLVDLIESGALPARNAGTPSRKRWRICRADLDALRGESVSTATARNLPS